MTNLKVLGAIGALIYFWGAAAAELDPQKAAQFQKAACEAYASGMAHGPTKELSAQRGFWKSSQLANELDLIRRVLPQEVVVAMAPVLAGDADLLRASKNNLSEYAVVTVELKSGRTIAKSIAGRTNTGNIDLLPLLFDVLETVQLSDIAHLTVAHTHPVHFARTFDAEVSHFSRADLENAALIKYSLEAFQFYFPISYDIIYFAGEVRHKSLVFPARRTTSLVLMRGQLGQGLRNLEEVLREGNAQNLSERDRLRLMRDLMSARAI